MKLSTGLVASALALVGIAACAASEPTGDETSESSSEALCITGKCKNLGGWGGWGGGSSGVLDPGTSSQTFTCGGKIICPPGNRIEWGYLTLSCNPNDPNDCVCLDPCNPGGGGWPTGTYNPCVAGTRYTCTSYGYCTCR